MRCTMIFPDSDNEVFMENLGKSYMRGKMFQNENIRVMKF